MPLPKAAHSNPPWPGQTNAYEHTPRINTAVSGNGGAAWPLPAETAGSAPRSGSRREEREEEDTLPP